MRPSETIGALPSRWGNAGDKVFTAVDVHGALAFVQGCLESGTYQFFRGQEDASWYPMPSWLRVADQDSEEADDSVRQFLGYTREVARLGGIHYSDDELVAIAQHYGLPTPFLDLTTDPMVAALFACPPATKHGNAKAAILLYSQEMIDGWQQWADSLTDRNALELVRIDVSNLWRLRAQRGLFLHIGITDFCLHRMPDRVEFPHPAGGLLDPDYTLYPVAKSPLELQLDVFFHLSSADKAKKGLDEFLPHRVKLEPVALSFPNTTPRIATAVKEVSGSWVRDEQALHDKLRSNIEPIGNWPLRTLSNTNYEPVWKFRIGELWPHSSWFSDSANSWLRTPVEPFQQMRKSNENSVDVDLSSYGETMPYDERGPCVFQVDPVRRTASLHVDVQYAPWRTSALAHATGRAQEAELRFGAIARNLWDGVRSKPLSDRQVARCMDRYFRHVKHYLDCELSDTPTRWDEYFGSKYQDHLRVEYVALGGGAQAVQVLCSDLWPAVRPDFDDVIEVVKEMKCSFPHLLQMIFPQYVFEFEKFADLYCTIMIPCQAFIGATGWLEHLGLPFNPRQVKIFGLA